MSLFGFDQAPKVFIYAQATDMRKGFDSLSGLVSNEMQMDPLSGYLFVFMNKNHCCPIKLFSEEVRGQI